MTFRFYADAGLTIPFVATIRHISTQSDRLVYYGDPAIGRMLQDATSPGVASIWLAIIDTAIGSGAAADWIKLSLTSGGLAGATPGNALDLGHTILSGVAGAIPIHIRFDTSAGEVGDRFSDLLLRLSNVVDTEV